MTRHPSWTPLLSALSLAIAVVMAGCGSSNDDSPSDLQNDPSQPGTTTRPGGSTEPDDMGEPDGTTPPDGAIEPGGTPAEPERPDDVEEPSEPSAPGNPTSAPPPAASFDPAPERLFALPSGEPVVVVADYAERPFVDGAPDRDSIGAFTLLETERDADGFPLRVRFACEGGGEYEKPAFQNLGPGGVAERTFSECAVGGLVYDGTLSSAQGTVTIEDFSVTRDGEPVLEATGAVSRGGTTSGNVRTAAWRFERYVDIESGVRLESSSVSDERDDRASPPTDRLSAELTVTAPWTGGTTLSGSTGDAPFAGRGDGAAFYTIGRLALDEEGGPFGAAFDADGGDPAAYAWTVRQEGGTTSDVLSRAALLDDCAEPGTILDVAFELNLCRSR